MNSRSCDYLWLSTFWSFLIWGFPIPETVTCSRWRRFLLTLLWPRHDYTNTETHTHTLRHTGKLQDSLFRRKETKEKNTSLQIPGPGSGFVLMSVCMWMGAVGAGGWGRSGVGVEGCGVSGSSLWQPSILHIETRWCHTLLLASRMTRSSFYLQWRSSPCCRWRI